MSLRARHIASAACLTLAACASSAPTNGAINLPGGIEVSGRTVFETLPPQDIAPDQCPLVLYSRADQSRRLYIALETPAMALMRIDGRTQQFARAATSGATSNRHFEQETYTSPDGAQITASVRFSAMQGANDAAAIHSASIAYTSPEGETAILPAVGLVTCTLAN